MSTAELKNILISQITAIEDKTLLQAIQAFIESKPGQKIYHTTPEQRKSIKEGQDQIARGEYFTNEQVENEVDKWLQEE